ncbi:hypothetical protein MMC30_005585 [Trapelia coarctata]|nr:hypothetical protein [Trapelia coarctata]
MSVKLMCCALYRALLHEASRTPIDELQKGRLQNVIKNRFGQNAKIQSPWQIVTALELGYQSLQTLRDAVPGQSQALQRLSRFLNEFQVPATQISRSAAKENANATKLIKPTNVPVVWPRPDVPSVLSRPFPSVTGKRHIPKLVDTNGLPFLRFKKPQSPFLSRVLRDKIKLRQKRYDRIKLLEEQITLAETEDEWDKLLTRMHGIQDDGIFSIGWVTVPRDALQDIHQKLKADYGKTKELAVKMFEIVEKEEALVKDEELERGRRKLGRSKPLRSQNS